MHISTVPTISSPWPNKSLQHSQSSIALLQLERGSSPLKNDHIEGITAKASRSPSWAPTNPLDGWRSGLRICICLAIFVCILNVVTTIIVTTTHGLRDGVSFFFKGSCSNVSTASKLIHLAINLLGTLLLGASNYTMQILTSPTRVDVDVAHSRGRWLDIGVPSLRNLRSMSWSRIVMFGMMGLSSIPLHLMYNSVAFESIGAIEYLYTVVHEDFLNNSIPIKAAAHTGEATDLPVMKSLATNGAMKKYEAMDCMEAFATTFITKYNEVLLVTTDSYSDDNLVAASLWNPGSQIPYAWICGHDYTLNPYLDKETVCTLSVAKSNAANWNLTGGWTSLEYKIDYCLINEVPEKCSLSFSLPAMLVVIVANLCKIIVMAITVRTLNTPPLATIGDALTSFLQEPDTTTEGMCLANKNDFKGRGWCGSIARPWRPVQNRWFKAASISRWLACDILCLTTISVGIYLFAEGMESSGASNLSQVSGLGFGVPNLGSVVNIRLSSVVLGVVVANLPQLIFSFLYLMYNALFTYMLEADEWSKYASLHKSLRVSQPAGKQRSTRYLQLPYGYSIPLLTLSALMHWLISASLFIVYVPVHRYHDDSIREIILKVGYSSIAIFTTIIVGSAALITLNLLGWFRKLNAEIPIVGSCSAAISAACHVPEEDIDSAYGFVRWGVVGGEERDIGHCCLSSLDIGKPVVGKLYA